MGIAPLTAPLNTTRWLWGVVAITLGAMLATHLYLVNEEHTRLLTKSNEVQRNLVDALSQRIQASIEKADLLNQRLAADLADMPERVSKLPYQQALAATINRIDDIDTALMIRRDGSMAGSSMPSDVADTPVVPLNFSDRAYFQYHAAHLDTALRIGHPIINKMSGRRIIPLSRRVNNHRGEFAGVVVVTLSIDALHQEFMRYGHSEDRFIALAHLDGTILVRHPNMEATSGANIRNTPQYTDHYLKRASGSFIDQSPIDHVIRRYYYQTLSTYPLLIVEGINQQAVLDEVMPDIRIKSALLGSLTLLVALLTLYLYQQLRATRAAETDTQIAMAKMRAFQDALNDYVIVALLDRDGRVVDANDRFCTLSAFSREELIGRRLPPIDGRIHDPEFAQTLKGVLASGVAWRGVRQARNKHGEPFWLQCCILPVPAAAGVPPMYLLAQTDITAIKQAQEQTTEINLALSQTLGLNLAILNSTRCGIFATDVQGTIVLFNAAAERLLGYERREVVELLSPLRFYDPASFPRLPQAASDSESPDYADYQPLLSRSDHSEWQWRRRDGSSLPVSVTINPILALDHSVRGYVTVFDDLTERHKLEAMKSDFISVVSHELRTPLTAIKGSLMLVKSTLIPAIDSGKGKLLDIGIDNCDKLVRLVSDILDVDKISRGQLSVTTTPQSVVPVIEKAIALNAPYASQLGVNLVFHAPKEACVVTIDADRMLQVLTNLLSNAAKFSSAGQSVTVSLEEDEQLLIVKVSDQGAGIPEAFKDKIFDRFTQSGSASTKNKGGSGLGLAIAKSLVELQGGQISFESLEGLGTSFYIRLPRAREPDTQPTLPVTLD